jgi:hypothetical protein
MKVNALFVSALVAFATVQGRADNFVTITPTGFSAASVTNRWAVGDGLSGLGYIDGNSGFPGATATNFFTVTGDGIPAGGNPSGFVSYLPSGVATPQATVGSALTPESYSGLTYVAANLGLIGPLSFYSIHHGATGDYLALIQPSVPTVSDQKPMSGPGGPLTAGGTGYFALSYAADNPGGWGANLFYYLRTDGLGETIFGSLVPALLSGSTDEWNLGANRGFTDLAYTSTDLGFGFGPSQFYYLRLDPVTETTFFGRLDPLTGTTTDIQNLGGVYRTLTFTATNVGYGANNFYTVGQPIVLGQVGSAFDYQVIASGSPTSFAVTSGTLPAGLILNAASGAITGTPTQAGSEQVFIAASNGGGQGLPLEITITINSGVGLPVISSPALDTGQQVGAAFSWYMIEASPGPITSYALTGSLPPGLYFYACVGIIYGTATEAGTYTVYLTATNGSGTGPPLALTIVIAPAGGGP